MAAYDINYYFPLYLYPEADRRDLFSAHQPPARRPNLNPALLAALAAALGREPSPEEVFHYVYAVLYTPAYRQRYAPFLRLDFPRIPLAADPDLFAAVAGLGERLVGLHLLKSAELDQPLARFEGAGDGRVESKARGFGYDPPTQRVRINPSQYFAPVPAEVWAYRVGGYQVAEKWLKDRQGRRLELAEMRRYCRIVTALARTIEIQRELDDLYPAVEARTIAWGAGGDGA